MELGLELEEGFDLARDEVGVDRLVTGKPKITSSSSPLLLAYKLQKDQKYDVWKMESDIFAWDDNFDMGVWGDWDDFEMWREEMDTVLAVMTLVDEGKEGQNGDGWIVYK